MTSCTVVNGSVVCGPCPHGYYASGQSGCLDIDECLIVQNGGCDSKTTCTNTPGGYTCSECPKGYIGDGYKGCAAKFSQYLSMGHGGDAGWTSFSIFLMVATSMLIVVVTFKLCSGKSASKMGNIDRIDLSGIRDAGSSIYDSSFAH